MFRPCASRPFLPFPVRDVPPGGGFGASFSDGGGGTWPVSSATSFRSSAARSAFSSAISSNTSENRRSRRSTMVNS